MKIFFLFVIILDIGLRNEVASLRASTAQKYQAAEDAALTEKPSAVAKLFQTAQNEAMILAENEKILKSFEDVEESMSAALRKSGDAVRGLQSSIKELADAEKEQLAGFDLLKDGIATSSKKFEGQREFRAGIDKILKAQGKDVKVLRGLSKDIRSGHPDCIYSCMLVHFKSEILQPVCRFIAGMLYVINSYD